MTRAFVRNDITQQRGATDPTLTRRRVSNAHSGYQLFRKAVGFFLFKKIFARLYFNFY